MLRRLARAIFGNAQLKVIAIAIAIAIWAYASSRLKEETGIDVPLTVRVPEGYEIVYQSHDRIQIWLRGPHFLIKRRQDEAAQHYLRMTTALKPEQLEEGVARLEVEPGWLNVPQWQLARTSVSVQPQFVDVHVSKVVKRLLPVEVTLSEEPHPGYEIRSRLAIPPVVSVTGPAVVVDRLEVVRTQAVSVWDAQVDLRRPGVPLVLEQTLELSEGLEVLVSFDAEPPQVAVRVEVGSEKEERRFEGIALQILRPPDFPYDVEIAPEQESISVLVSGLPQDIARLTAASVTAYVDLRDLQEPPDGATARYKVEVRLLLPEHVPVSAGPPEPDMVTVVLSKPPP